MRILIVGDSGAFHRARFGQLLEQAWPWQLRLRFPQADLWVRSQPGCLVDKVVEQVALFGASLALFDFVIVQVGVGDSCPRPLPLVMWNVLRWLGGMRLGKLINQHYPMLLRFYHRSWTSESVFRNSLLSIRTQVHAASTSTRVLFIPIVPPCKHLAAMSAGAYAAAQRYNEIIHEVARAPIGGSAAVLDDFLDECSEDFILEDGHHLTPAGHALLATHVNRAVHASASTGHNLGASLARSEAA
jgi:lysophospholipase L1-like esterase